MVGAWFFPASSTTKTGRHDIAEILLKVALNTKNQIKSSHVSISDAEIELLLKGYQLHPYSWDRKM
jgi:hypothetical protein